MRKQTLQVLLFGMGGMAAGVIIGHLLGIGKGNPVHQILGMWVGATIAGVLYFLFRRFVKNR